jgi:hypothetical protein
MKKLSGKEIDVIINEVNIKVNEIEKLEGEKLLNNNSNFSELKELVSNLNKINNELYELKDVINDKCSKLGKEFNCNLFLIKNNFSDEYYLNYIKKNNGGLSNYNKLYNKLILRNINNELNVEELINSLVKELKD